MKTKPLCRYFLSVYIFKKSKRSAHIALHGNPPQGYGASPVRWDHTVLPATRHRWARPALTPAIQAGTLFTYPGGMEGWVDLVTRKRRRRESNSRPLGPESNALTTEPPSKVANKGTNNRDPIKIKFCMAIINWNFWWRSVNGFWRAWQKVKI